METLPFIYGKTAEILNFTDREEDCKHYFKPVGRMGCKLQVFSLTTIAENFILA